MAAPKTIILRTSTPVLRKEGVAAGTILPGHLIEGADSALKVHSTAGGNARCAVAIEYFPGNDIDDQYETGDQVMYAVFKPGEEFYGIVAAGAAAIAAGDPLESAGDGTLRKHTPVAADSSGDLGSEEVINTRAIVAYAREAVNNSGGANAVRIRAEAA